ncbi:hypothetical protein GJ744_005073 [Endocarpon pusillum]|uniref:Uncharacterized protein n=1 Tax=Endocarpon pusillum TaxID=364733 RepID=A0A8H7AQG3_9EURO|nr:hypothetical protein GJ744_005073 [Endocarpon pusillum]
MEAVQTITQPPPAVVRPDKTTISIFSHIKAQLAAIPPILSTTSDHQVAAPEPPETVATDPSQLCSRTQSTNASTQTPATSILLTTKLFFLSKVHVAPSLPVQDELELLWDESIKARLCICLVHEIQRGTCVQELMMAGRRADHLKPTIVVTCGDMETRKRVQKVFKRQEWLQKLLKVNGMLFVAAVDPTHLSSFTTGTIVGLAVGVSLGMLIMLGSLVMLYRSRRRLPDHEHQTVQEPKMYLPSTTTIGGPSTTGTGEVNTVISSQRASRELPSKVLDRNFLPQPLALPPSPPTAMNQMPTINEMPIYHIPAPTTYMQEPVASLASKKNVANHEIMKCTLDSNQISGTLCGRQLTISESVNGGSIQCTLGGVIVVDGNMYGMTVGHAFPLDHAYPASELTSIITSEASQRKELDESDCTIDTEEAFWFGLESGHDLSEQVISNPACNNNTPMQHAEEAATDNTDETRPVAASGLDQQFSRLHDVLVVYDKAVDQSDWALLNLPYTSSPINNWRDLRNDWFNTVVVGTADDFVQGDISVLFRDRSFSGVLRKSMSTIICEGRAYDVRLVVLDNMLPRGSSGSWVVAGNKLCGHIIAVRENVPWAYMMPVGPIFEDIKRVTGAREVGLFSPVSAQQEQSETGSGGRNQISFTSFTSFV